MLLWAAAVTLPKREESPSESVGLNKHMRVTALGGSLASQYRVLGWRLLCRGLSIDGLAIPSGAIPTGVLVFCLAAPSSELLPQGITLTSQEGLGWAPCQV